MRDLKVRTELSFHLFDPFLVDWASWSSSLPSSPWFGKGFLIMAGIPQMYEELAYPFVLCLLE